MPGFVGIDPDTYNINATKIEDAIIDRTWIIRAANFNGHPAGFDEIDNIAEGVVYR